MRQRLLRKSYVTTSRVLFLLIFLLALTSPTAGGAQSKANPSRQSTPAKERTSSVSQQLSFRGLVPGVTTEDDLLKTFADRPWIKVECSDLSNDGVEYCDGSEWDSDKHENKEYHRAEFYKGKLSSYAYYFNHDEWQSFADALEQKYGRPWVYTKRYQNMMGAIFVGKTMTWQRGHSYLNVREYAVRFTQSAIMLVDEKLDAAVRKIEREAEAQDNKRLIE